MSLLFLNQAIQCDHGQMLTHVADFWNETAVFVLPDSSKIQLIKLQMSLMLQILKRMLLQGSSTFAPPFLCFCCYRGSHTLDASTIHTTTLFLSQAMIHGNICCANSSLSWLLHEIARDKQVLQA